MNIVGLTEMQQQNAQAVGHLNKQIQSMRGFLETLFQQLRRSLDVRPQNYDVDIKHQNWNAGDVRNGKLNAVNSLSSKCKCKPTGNHCSIL